MEIKRTVVNVVGVVLVAVAAMVAFHFWQDDTAQAAPPPVPVSTTLPQCPTEDSPGCVWDSGTQGTSRAPLDSPRRFVVNGSGER